MATGLHVVSSNRLELLGGRLADALGRPRRDPLGEEIVVVQSRGMARWVQWELARRTGICARTRFPFPKHFLQKVRDQVVPEAAGEKRFEPDAMTWRVWAELEAHRTDPVFAEASRYAGDDPRRRFQLATRVAGLLDQYAVYRPDFLASWEAGTEGDWQAALWRAIRPGRDAWPESRWLEAVVSGLERGPVAGLPERVALFGIAGLPPAYLRVLAALATQVEVTLYTLQPTTEFWADLVSRREEDRHLRRAGRDVTDASGLHLERGPRLLMSLGRLGRSFLRQLADHGAGGGEDPFEDPGEDSLLHLLQSDLLHLRNRTADGAAPVRIRLLAEDPSLRVHVCHSPRRELEVLQDQLLDAFESNPTLEPRDILVLTPDIEGYAPLIHAVFGAPEDERCRIPYSIADRVPLLESSLAKAFLRILSLPGRRCGRSEIEPLLEVPALRRRFGIPAEGVQRIRAWLETLGTSWGLDAEHRGSLGLPPFPQGTWRQGADRLLLGAAMASGDGEPIGGLGPVEGIEGDGAILAGAFAALVTALSELQSLRTRALPLADWRLELGRYFSAFFLPEADEEFDARLVRGALDRFGTSAGASGFDGVVPLEAIRGQLEHWLSEERSAGGFLRGGVTFAALKPMRSIPARVIAVLGLNDSEFPRQAIPLGFDLIAQKPRAGDEAREADDRHLFLETLLSARDRLHLSFVGQSIRDNAPLPPSVVVGELLDHLADIAEGGATAVEGAVVVRHPLHAFSADYFGRRGDPRLFRYSEESRRAAEVSCGGIVAVEPPFLVGELKSVGEPDSGVELDDLLEFLRNPAKFFLGRTLGVRLPRTGAPTVDRELFSLEGRGEFRLKQRWLEEMRSGATPGALSVRACADGNLPLGPAGELDAHSLGSGLSALLASIPAADREEHGPLPFEVRLGGTLLRGRLEGLTAGGLVLAKPAKFKAGDLLDLWARLLVLSVVPDVRTPRSARMWVEGDSGDVETWQLSPPPDPKAELSSLLELFAAGMKRPLPLFPRSSAEYSRPAGPRTRKSPLERALGEWEGNDRVPGEAADPAMALCFGAVRPHPLNDEFAALAGRVFGPAWANSGKGSA
ncbi:MAG: exodeoxyribonuclease V subunit gamma [Verrucomicrobiota bacterium]